MALHNGDHARLENLEQEVARLRTWRHDKASPMLQTHESDIGVLKVAVAKSARNWDGWKNWALAALLAAVVFLLLHGGLPRLGP